jgi:signal transduction histidine kinase
VRGSARHLLDLITDVLDLSRIEAGQMEVRAAPFDLRASVERIAGSVRPLAEKKSLALEARLPAHALTLVGDQRRVEQILLNLLNNAIKFTERGSVVAELEALEAIEGGEPPCPSPGPWLRVRVRDTGMGIRPEDLATLFRPFHQLDTGLARQHEGTGLGLSICRRLAGLMGGAITVSSRWGEGSEFAVTLPVQAPAPP